jgi:hypothetical protein
VNLRSDTSRYAFVAAVILLFALAAGAPRLGVVFIAIAAVLFLFAGSSLSIAGGLRKSLAPFLNRPVQIRIWGEPLPIGGPYRIESIRAVGVGLHLFVSCGSGLPVHIKIAQPRSVRIAAGGAEIGAAKYVQCAGRNLPRVAETAALSITLSESTQK